MQFKLIIMVITLNALNFKIYEHLKIPRIKSIYQISDVSASLKIISLPLKSSKIYLASLKFGLKY